MMTPRIEQFSEKKLIGKSLQMSLLENTTPQLWRSFMLTKKAIENSIGNNLYSIQVYHDTTYFNTFSPKTMFTKWAAIEVANHTIIPKGFKTFTLEHGIYAVFLHKGLASDFQKTISYIFNEWLPKSIYELDNRPHFELLGEKYKNNDPNSEEEIWIPIKDKY